jgi:ankyrin repeat protein
MWAASQGYDSIVKLLLGHGANVNLQNKDGQTALQVAEERGNRNAIDAIKEFNAGILSQVHASCSLSCVSFWLYR